MEEHTKAVALQDRMQRALNRINASTSTARVRADEVERASRHGQVDDLVVRLERQVARLERVADELERELGLR